MMNIRVFNAPSTEEGYRLLQQRYGSEISVMRVERDAKASGYVFTVSIPRQSGLVTSSRSQEVQARAMAIMRQAGFSSSIIGRVSEKASSATTEDEVELIGRGLSELVSFGAFEDFARSSRFVLFVGAPGSGKTATLAKAAAGLAARGESVALVNYDVGRLGGGSQLSSLSSIYRVPLIDLSERSASPAMDTKLAEQFSVVLCDTPGFHPWRFTELDDLMTEAERIGGEIVLVCPAGLDASETADMLATAKRLSIRHAIITKCDMSRKLGSVMNAVVQENFTVLGCQRSRSLSEYITQQSGASIAELICEQVGRVS